MSVELGIFVLWMVATGAATTACTCDDIWGTNWWRFGAISIVGYFAFATIARHGVAW